MSEGRTRLTQDELKLAHNGLCGMSIGDGPCSCLVHWVEALQKEADDLRIAKRGFQIMARKMFTEMVPREFQTAAIEEGRYERAGGDADCSICRQPYVEHPEIPGFPTFHVLCNHFIVKL